MNSAAKIHIIGIGDDGFDGLTAQATQRIGAADLIIGNPQALTYVDSVQAEKLPVGADLNAIVERVKASSGKNIVVLTSGDPLFYGVARYLCDVIGKEHFEVLPHVSSMQLAFARVKESWDEAYLANLATQSLERVVQNARLAEKVGLFTTDEHTPAAVAKALLALKLDYFSAYVCENLGSPNERVTQGELAEIAEQQFGLLNVMILVRKPGVPDRPIALVGKRLFGNPDEVFLQSKPKRGLLTSAETRSIALSQLDLGPTSIVWDVGAGSGSVSIEAAMIAAEGAVYAIEMDPEDHGLIKSNADTFGVTNLTPILGKAPEAWEDIPDPDCIFIGGAGRHVRGIIEPAFARLKPGGRIVLNIGSIENLHEVHELLQRLAGEARATMINIAHSTYQLERHRFESLNPTFLITAIKPVKS
ncbi:bifunctional cobalt-precorrin-7 (C(5))-methyltransferase/cobalt-precorrin-6B (C(15))-methyltransferase [Blastopirellula marina]|nr:bifunctional cobalt-precorrin-7 (C(5))-methyltransferase/cobalt-precorrin-6B (C(15))-methyltransferase [Blastopirellula marina]